MTNSVDIVSYCPIDPSLICRQDLNCYDCPFARTEIIRRLQPLIDEETIHPDIVFIRTDDNTVIGSLLRRTPDSFDAPFPFVTVGSGVVYDNLTAGISPRIACIIPEDFNFVKEAKDNPCFPLSSS